MVKRDNALNWRQTDFTPHSTEHRDKDKHVCNGVNLILCLACITVTITHARRHKENHSQVINSIAIIPVSPSVCLC